MTIYGFDFDGTLVTSWTAEPLPGVVSRLHALPSGAKTFIASNQAGPVFRAVLGDPKYPTVEDVATRIAHGLAALGWRPDLLLVAVHPGKSGERWQEATRNVGKDLFRLLCDALPDLQVFVLVHAEWRKPAPKMLQTALGVFGARPVTDMLYVGDMESDEAAARAAGCRYQDVERWLGGADG
jgi:FMN phosphatase YigB (HAD superfamily)